MKGGSSSAFKSRSLFHNNLRLPYSERTFLTMMLDAINGPTFTTNPQGNFFFKKFVVFATFRESAPKLTQSFSWENVDVCKCLDFSFGFDYE